MTPESIMAGLLEDVTAGKLDAVPMLADHLTDQGDPRGARLKLRWRRWLLARQRAEEALASQRDEMTSRFAALVETIRRAGGTADVSVTISNTVVADQDALLQDYVARLMQEES